MLHHLRGGFFEKDAPNLLPKFDLKIFVSSTFTDTHAERNILLERIAPEMVTLASQHKIQVTFLDMRFGVRDENTADHLTWIACRQELERCSSESSGIFFISLQSHKYGYRPIPKYLSDEHFQARFKSASTPEPTSQLAAKWYQVDTNSVPPRYELCRLDSNNKSEFWNVALPSLVESLADLNFDVNHKDGQALLLNRSVTEWELKVALHDPAQVPQCFWWHREFVGVVTDANDPKKDYDDVRGDVALEGKFRDLLSYMRSRLGSANARHVTISFADYVAKESAAGTEYFHIFEHTT